MNDKLQQAKDLAAKEYGYESFEQFDDKSTFGYDHRTPEIIQRIAERYHALMSEWIDVNDRLPEHDEVVLGLYQTDSSDWYKYPTNLQLLNFYKKSEFNKHFRDKSTLFPINSDKISHWKPLPQPPKQ